MWHNIHSKTFNVAVKNVFQTKKSAKCEIITVEKLSIRLK